MGWILSETYEFENNISATVNLSSTHVLKISVQESDINYDSCFQKFWQIESSETKAKSFSDFSKHVISMATNTKRHYHGKNIVN